MPYEIINPKESFVPILVSVPHSGIEFPDDISDTYKRDMIQAPEDTDWFVDQLYNFVSDMGITMIKAKYSRWVIDLNRNPKSQPLYNDGRVITDLTPLTTFNGEGIYKSSGPSEEEVNKRLKQYYHPYYQKIDAILDQWQNEYDHVLLFDAHSIKQLVTGIRKEKFPDLILGDVDCSSAHERLIHSAEEVLSGSQYGFQHNTPFKGGHITRNFGRPNEKRHALQLEMSKTVYMEDNETDYSESRANSIRTILQNMFESLKVNLNELNGNA